MSEFNLKKIERLIYVRNMNSIFNKKGPIEYIVEVNIFYKGHRERTEINVIGGKNGMLFLTWHSLSTIT